MTICDSKLIRGGDKSGNFCCVSRDFKLSPSLQFYAFYMNSFANWKSMGGESNKQKQRIAGFEFWHTPKLL